ncbi:FAD-dependent monooxygenase [Rhizobium sp. C4]|uniref:FAD-dependent monooxygenase n=1 Tax=Rhizobium sp. C4 TaxID=1349800 RepID=UPI001E609897|nr:FAD-dependent monooxygenase [Rhizobium sp. C4]MCD2173664.1 FAD-dependent monooxygenase [Rhizobium sp. C4]
MVRKLRVAIVGGGLGGLAVARALRGQADTVILEQGSQFGEVGAGINMSPNAFKVLRELGLEDPLRRCAFQPEFHVFRDWRSGRTLFRANIKSEYETRFGAPHLSVHRADLHGILAAGLPERDVRFQARCRSVSQNEHCAVVLLDNGDEVEADVVIGADGIKSAVRESMFGKDDPEFTGNVAWRLTVPVEALPYAIEPAVTNWLGPGGHVVHYYVRSGQLVNIVAVCETSQWTAESWALKGDPAELLQTFSGWNRSLLTLLARAETCFKWGLFDRPPLARWSQGRITLLGDAAHPMLPFLGQGAAMALEDGLTLGLLLSRDHGTIAERLSLYERLRLPRTARAQIGSRARAAENHLRSPLQRFVRNLKFKIRQYSNPHATLNNGEWLYGYDVHDALRAAGN